ncbi:MAG: hypothetical protein OEW90_00985 [Betaproteobacteria bacterium]|nr:hypothetical protein [Betaproteobacteria bacterium]MDH4322692.1 hypothetical protein [Betaproteobacteria bacterium]
MSRARQCDRCGAFFSRVIGAITLDVHEATTEEDVDRSEEDIDLCAQCSTEFNAFMNRPASPT